METWRRSNSEPRYTCKRWLNTGCLVKKDRQSGEEAVSSVELAVEGEVGAKDVTLRDQESLADGANSLAARGPTWATT